MRTQNFTIKTVDREGVDIAIEWAAKEGWNPGLHDVCTAPRNLDTYLTEL